MRSHGQLWGRITDAGNLLAAWRRVRRGHAHAGAVLDFERHLGPNLAALRAALLDGSYAPGAYRQFRVHDPKPRTISCAPVADRVVHHALCAVVAPVLERSFVPVSFACRAGFGSHAACALARRYAKRARYFCKMDVRRYFDSIGHDRLLGVLLPKFRERPVRDLVERLVRHPVPGQGPGHGLPIGNLTSQWFANAFLDAFDHAALAGLGGPPPLGYLRYMDDFVFFCGTKAACWRLRDAAVRWLAAERGLAVKEEATVVAPVLEGVPFLGLRIWPGGWRLRRGRFLRTRRTFAARCRQYAAGTLGDARFAQCCASSDGALRWFGFRGILDDLAPGEGSASGSNRVKRGGSWNNNSDNCTSSNRNNNDPSNRNNNNGFRLVSTLSGTGPHPGRPAFRACGNEHARARRPVASANAARAPFIAPDGDVRCTGGPRSCAAGGRTDATSASLPFRTPVDPGRHSNLLEGNLT